MPPALRHRARALGVTSVAHTAQSALYRHTQCSQARGELGPTIAGRRPFSSKPRAPPAAAFLRGGRSATNGPPPAARRRAARRAPIGGRQAALRGGWGHRHESDDWIDAPRPVMQGSACCKVHLLALRRSALDPLAVRAHSPEVGSAFRAPLREELYDGSTDPVRRSFLLVRPSPRLRVSSLTARHPNVRSRVALGSGLASSKRVRQRAFARYFRCDVDWLEMIHAGRHRTVGSSRREV